MLKNRCIGWASASVLLLAALGCGDNDNDGPDNTAGSGGGGGSAGEDSAGGSAGDDSSAGTGGMDNSSGSGGTDNSAGSGSMAGSANLGTDAGVSEDAGVTGDPDSGTGTADSGITGATTDAGTDAGTPVVANNCPVAAPQGVAGQVFAIESVDLVSGDVVIRNVSGADQEVTTAWQWCDFPDYDPMVTADTTFAAGEAVSFNFDSSDLVGGEMGMFINAQYTNNDALRAYVIWGAGPNATAAGAGREQTAVGAGLWTDTDRITIAAGHAGFIATGASNTAAGYTSAPAECF